MAKRFYLSTKITQASRAEALLKAMIDHGWERAFDWAANPSSNDGHSALAVAEVDAIRTSDVLIVLLPGGYGTHVEIGVALALGKPIVLYVPDQKTLETPYPCIFHYHPAVKLLVSTALDVDKILSLLPESSLA